MTALSRTTPLGLPVVPDVQHVPGVSGRHGHRIGGRSVGGLDVPVEPAVEVGGRTGDLLTVFHDDRRRRKLRQFKRFGDHRQVFDIAARFDAAGCGDQGDRLGVVDAGGQFGGGETTEDDGVDCTDPMRTRASRWRPRGSSACIR